MRFSLKRPVPVNYSVINANDPVSMPLSTFSNKAILEACRRCIPPPWPPPSPPLVNGTKFCVILEIPTGAISEKSNGFQSNTKIIIVNIFGEDIRCFMSSATHRKLDGLVQITHKVSDGGPAPTLLLGRNQTEQENSRISM